MNDDNQAIKKKTWRSSGIFKVLEKTRRSIASNFSSLFSSSSVIDEEEIEDLHDTLITSDIGFDVSETLIRAVRSNSKRSKISGQKLSQILHGELVRILAKAQCKFDLSEYSTPTVILMVGVNGVGKTTTSAKIANYLKLRGHSVMFAACDTFRSAAIEQLQAWGQRLDIRSSP